MNSVFVILTFVSAVFGVREKVTVHNSYEKPSGTIHSKDFPYSYNPTEIEIFEFRGRLNENVQITFEYFNLFPKTTNEKCGIESSFITYKTSESNEWEKLCGDKKPLPIMSEENSLILRYEAIVVPVNMREGLIGFNATFRFVKYFGINYKIPPNIAIGEDPINSRCEFTYDSENFPSGVISSPNFPGMFPKKMQCFYIFSGPETNILFQFTHFNLLGSEDCRDETETKDLLRIAASLDGFDDNKWELCGNKNPFNFTITNRTAFVTFYHKPIYSDNYLAGSDFVGFNATFLFTNDTIDNACDSCRSPGGLFFCVCLYLILYQCLHF